MSRKIVLCDKYGVKNVELEDVEVGQTYDLLTPIQIKDRDGAVRDTVSTVTIETEPTRKNQREWGKLSEDEQIDRMITDLTNLKPVHIDYLSLKDLANISEIIQAFLPENLVKEIGN